MSQAALELYKSTYRSVLSNREIEADVFGRAAALLNDCYENWEGEEFSQRLAAAVEYNQKLWSILQSELIRADYPLPTDLRKNLLKMSALFDKSMLEFVYLPRREKLKIMVDINRAIASGLSKSS